MASNVASAYNEKILALEKLVYSSTSVVDIVDLVRTTTGKNLSDSSRSDYVKSFDEALKLLGELRLKSDNESSNNPTHANEIDAEFRKGLQSHSQKLNKLAKQLHDIEQSVGEFSHGASQIGDRLTETDSQIIRITEAKQLLRFYSRLRDYDATSLSSSQSLEHCIPSFFMNLTLPDLCLVLSQLRRISADLCVTATPISHSHSRAYQSSQAMIEKQIEKARSNVQIISDNVEQNLLNRFRKCAMNVKVVEGMNEDTDFSRLNERNKQQEAYYANIKKSVRPDSELTMDVDKIVEMRYLASLLQQFNNGANLQRRFVSDVIERQLRGQLLDEENQPEDFPADDGSRKHVANSDLDDESIRDSSSGGFASGDDDDKKPSELSNQSAQKDVTANKANASSSPKPTLTPPKQKKGLFSMLFGRKNKEMDNLELVEVSRPNDGFKLNRQESAITLQTPVVENKATAIATQEMGMEALQKFSKMFTNISTLCEEQFKVISVVFCRDAAFRVVRLLVQRLLNDPAVGIQSQIETILDPPMANMQLSLPEFLDALLVVHEKTHGLLVLLKFCCQDLIVRCVDDNVVESSGLSAGSRIKGSAKKSKQRARSRKSLREIEEDNMIKDERKSLGGGDEDRVPVADSGIDSLHRFVEDQVLTVVRSYREGHFDKELDLLRIRIVSITKDLILYNPVSSGNALSSQSASNDDQFSRMFTVVSSRKGGQVSGGGMSGMMENRAGRMMMRKQSTTKETLNNNQQVLIEGLVSLSSKSVNSIPWMMRSVASQSFIKRVMDLTGEAITRCKMMDREASLEDQTSHISTIHVILLRFVFDCLLTPTISAAKRLVVGPSNQFPQLEFIHLIKASHEIAAAVAYQHFDLQVLPALSSTAATPLKSLRSNLMKKLDRNVSELFICGIGVLSTCIERFIDKALSKACYSAEEAKSSGVFDSSPTKKKMASGFESDDEDLYHSDDDDDKSEATGKPKPSQASESTESSYMGRFLMLANESENEIMRKVAMEVYAFVDTTVTCFSIPNPARIQPFYPLFIRLVEDKILRVILTGINRNLKISEVGGIQLCKDLDLLQASFAKLKNNEIRDMFSKFRELMMIFLAPGDKVELIVRDILGRFTFSFASSEFGLDIKKSEILDLVKRRSDYRVRGIRSAWAKRLFGEDILAFEKSQKEEESKQLTLSNIWDVGNQDLPTIDGDMNYAQSNNNSNNDDHNEGFNGNNQPTVPARSNPEEDGSGSKPKEKSLWRKLKGIVSK